MKKLLKFKEVKIALILVLIIGVYGIANINNGMDNFYQKIIGQSKKTVLYQKTIEGITLSSNLYDLNKEYIYAGTETNPDNIISKIEISGDGVLSVKNNELRLYQKSTNLLLHKWEYVKVSSGKFDLSKDYIFNNNEVINTKDPDNIVISGTTKCTTNIRTLENGSQELVLFYNGSEVTNWDIVEFQSKNYEIQPGYIITDGIHEINIDDPEDLKVYNGIAEKQFVSNVGYIIIIKHNSEDQNSVTSLIEVDYKIKEYAYDDSYIYVYEQEFNSKNITSSYDRKTIYNEENNTIQLKYGDNILREWKIISYHSDKYKDYMDKDYIYVGAETFDPSSIASTNLVTEYDKVNNKYKLKLGDKIIKEWEIISISSNYNISMNSEYIYTGFNKFNINDISHSNNVSLSENNNILTLTLKGKTIKTWTIESLSTNYKIINDYIIADSTGTISTDKISHTNNLLVSFFQVAPNAPKSIYVYYKGSKIKEYNIVEWKSTGTEYEKYISKDYIYVGNGIIDKTKITHTSNSVLEEDPSTNKLNLKLGNDTIKSWDIVSWSSSKYEDYLKNYNFVYTGSETFEMENVDVVNADKKMKNNQFVISRNNEVIKAWDIECFSVDDYKVAGNRIFIEEDKFDENKLHTVNVDYSISGNEIVITHTPLTNGVKAKSYYITKFWYSSNAYKDYMDKDYIYASNKDLTVNDIDTLPECTKEINDNKFQIKYNGVVIKEWDIVKYSSSNSMLSSTDYILYPLITSDTLDNFRNNNYITVTKGTVEYTDDYKVNIKYKDDTLQTWDIVGIESEKYYINTPPFYLNIGYEEFKKENIIKHNCDIEVLEDSLVIKYKDQEIHTFNFITYNSKEYDLSKEYIYIGSGTFNKDLITTNNCTISEPVNGILQILLSTNGSVIKEYKIVSYGISGNTPPFTDDGGNYYVYGNFKEVNIEGMLEGLPLRTQHLKKQIVNDRLELVYEDTGEVLRYWNLVRWYSDTYDLSKNYIYTLSDIDESLINVVNGSPKHSDDNIDIVYDNDKIAKTYKILKLTLSDEFTIDDNIIYTGKGKITVEELLEKITSDNLIIKIYRDDQEVTTGNINTDDKVKIINETYGEIAEYSINNNGDYIDISDLDKNEDSKIIYNIEKQTTFDKLKDKIDTNGQIKLKDKDKNELPDDSKLATGQIISIEFNNSTIEYKVSVLGDLTGDGETDITDVARLYRHIKGANILTEDCYIKAGLLVSDAQPIIPDVAKLYKIVKEGA